MIQSAALVPLVGASFLNLINIVSNSLLLPFILESYASVLCEPYSLNWHKILIRALNRLASIGDWHVTSSVFGQCVEIIIHNNIACFCLRTPNVYFKLDII